MIKLLLGGLALAYLIWIGVAVYIAQQAYPPTHGVGAAFVLSDYQRCVTVQPGPIEPTRVKTNYHVRYGRIV